MYRWYRPCSECTQLHPLKVLLCFNLISANWQGPAMRMHLCPFQSTMDKNRLEPFTWFGLTDETITSFLPPNRCWYDEESPSSQGLVLATCFKGGFTQHGRVKCFTKIQLNRSANQRSKNPGEEGSTTVGLGALHLLPHVRGRHTEMGAKTKRKKKGGRKTPTERSALPSCESMGGMAVPQRLHNATQPRCINQSGTSV